MICRSVCKLYGLDLLRKVNHPQAHDNFRVVLKDDGDEVEIGSIGGVLGRTGCKLDVGHRHGRPDARRRDRRQRQRP
jgi:hypothetical protein